MELGMTQTDPDAAAPPGMTSPADVRVHLSVVVPIYNEQSFLMEMAEQLAPYLDEIAGERRWQFVLVDNGSRDGSRDICDQIVRRWPESLKLELQQPNYGEALYQGLMNAAGPWAFIINVDFWDIPFMRWCFRTRGTYDMVMGSKRADGVLNQQGRYRRLLSWGLNTILQMVFNFPGTDTHGQKFIHLPTLRPVFSQCVMRRGQFDTEFTLRAARAKLWLAEVPVPIVELRKARNFMLHKIGRNIVDILRLRQALLKSRTRTAMRYHRWSREDVEKLDLLQTRLIIEMGRLHRDGVIPLDSAPLPAPTNVENQAARAPAPVRVAER
jgi:glycosyltransferase involved in cell wall biosynthesis